jgi:UDP-N-acetylmuramate--alanine ligase
VITLGCGDVYRIVPQLLGSLDAASAPDASTAEESGE